MYICECICMYMYIAFGDLTFDIINKHQQTVISGPMMTQFKQLKLEAEIFGVQPLQTKAPAVEY